MKNMFGKDKSKIETRAVDKLIPYKKNTRTHSEKQIDQIVESIKQFGFTNPLLIDKDNIVYAGNGRLRAAIKMGLTELPCLVMDNLNNEQKKALSIADNKIAENAEWDWEMLAVEMTELKDKGFDIGVLAFNHDELKEIFEDEDDAAAGENLQLANVTIEEPTTKTKKGEIWQLDNHIMLIVSVFEGWPFYTKYLLEMENALFIPYAGPVVTLSLKAEARSLVIAQPDTYISGHLIDRHIEQFGADNVKMVATC
jgi:hypothetical protein